MRPNSCGLSFSLYNLLVTKNEFKHYSFKGGNIFPKYSLFPGKSSSGNIPSGVSLTVAEFYYPETRNFWEHKQSAHKRFWKCLQQQNVYKDLNKFEKKKKKVVSRS